MKSTISKNKQGYGYLYTDLAQINQYCEENGIRYSQEVDTCETNGKDYIITRIYQDGNETIHRGCQVVEAVLQGIKNPVQEYGSSLTYCRRYSLLMALGLATEDDDGATFTEKKEATPEDAKKWTFGFGKYKDKKMSEVLEEDAQYVTWYINNKATDYYKGCYEILTGVKLPTDEEIDARINLISEIHTLEIETDTDHDEVLKYFGAKSEKDLTDMQLVQCKDLLETKKKKGAKTY